MAEKMSTLILKVDLDCRQCYKKIRKILCKLQDQERIRTISYDSGSHTIAVAGPFDPHKLSCRIRCMGGKVIKGIDIIVHGHGGDGGGSGDRGGGGCRPEMMASPPPMKKGKKKQKGKPPKEMEPPPPPPAEAEHQPPQGEEPPQTGHPPDSHIAEAMPAMIEEMKPRERPAELEPPPPPANDLYVPAAAPMEQKEWPRERLPPTPPPPAAAKPVWPVDVTTTTTVEIPSWPAQPMPAAGGSCGCSCCPPCYRGYYDGCRCCSCGRVYGYAVGVLPPAAGCYGAGGGYRPGCHQLLGEEDPASACTIM